jgi:hypothetical protein
MSKKKLMELKIELCRSYGDNVKLYMPRIDIYDRSKFTHAQVGYSAITATDNYEQIYAFTEQLKKANNDMRKINAMVDKYNREA